MRISAGSPLFLRLALATTAVLSALLLYGASIIWRYGALQKDFGWTAGERPGGWF